MRHEVPTVFVQGHAPPLDVEYVDAQFCDALLRTTSVRYSILWIDVIEPEPVMVGIEAGFAAGPVETHASGSDVRAAGDACIAAFLERVQPVVIERLA